MELSALLTSAGINVGLCILFLSLYSILRKQPGNFNVYFGRMLAEERNKQKDGLISLERFVPSPSWILKALQYTEDEIISIAGLDAAVFLRSITFSIRIFTIAAVVCALLILPLNYYGQEMKHKQIPSESLDVFTIANVGQRSKWLWVHCLVLYIICSSACALLYFEYKSIARMRQLFITQSPPDPSHFSILVRGIPKSSEEPLSHTVRNFFMKYHGSSYLSHKIVVRVGKIQKLMTGAEKVYKKFANLKGSSFEQGCPPAYRCGLCGGNSNAYQLYTSEVDLSMNKICLDHTDSDSINKDKECAAAFVFFTTRYAALVASQVRQTYHPMLWVTEIAPGPYDVYWSNLWLPYKQLWVRRIATLMGSIVFMFVFLIPVTIVQGLSQLDQLQQMFPFWKGILKKTFVSQIVTGYLPSAILQLFLLSVPPTMILFSSVEGPASRSARKKSACYKVLYFTIWNVFFVNVFSGSVISQINAIFRPKEIPVLLAKAVPKQATFFTTYVLTSGWASLSSELMQLFALLWHSLRYILGFKDDPSIVPTFPYHTEVPRVLLFGLLGFACSILAPLILPFLLVYFLLGYVVYRNQLVNVYCSRYETAGQMWPTVHNTTIFSLVLTQIIALGVFLVKESPVAAAFTVPLLVLTVLFNEYCRHRFYPLFKSFSAQDFIEMDRADEQNGRMAEIHEMVLASYCQFREESQELTVLNGEAEDCNGSNNEDSFADSAPDYLNPTEIGLPVSGLQKSISNVRMFDNFNNNNTST